MFIIDSVLLVIVMGMLKIANIILPAHFKLKISREDDKGLQSELFAIKKVHHYNPKLKKIIPIEISTHIR